MRKVLILGVSTVQLDAIKILKEMDFETYAAAYAPGPANNIVDHFAEINFIEEDKVIEFVRDNEIECVYSVGSDAAMPVCTSINEKLGLANFVSSKIAKICNNKIKLREYLGNRFRGNINFQNISDKDTKIRIDVPFIMKPSDSQGQRGVRLIHNREDYNKFFEECKSYSRAGWVIIEEYIDGPELSINAYIVDGQVAFLQPSDRKVWSQFQGGLIHRHVLPSKEMNNELEKELKDLVNRTVNKLGIKNGPLYFQIMIRDGQPYIIEVTPRLDGCHMWNLLKYYTNVNLLKLTFEHLLNGRIDEIKNYIISSQCYSLEFLCQEPNTKADFSKNQIPSNALVSRMYYKQGEMIRAINGQYEKIGYFITKEMR